MGKILIEPGKVVLAGDKIVEILSIPSLSKLLVKDIESGRIYTIGNGEVRAEVKSGGNVGNSEVHSASELLDNFTESEMDDARHRHEIILQHLNSAVDGKLDKAALANELKIGPAQTYRLLKKFDRELGPITLLPERAGRKKESGMISAETEAIIKFAMEQYKGKGAKQIHVFKLVEQMCSNAGIKCPAKRTVSIRINALSEKEKTRRIDGFKKAEQDYRTRGGRFITAQPFEQIQIDHCIVDVIIVDHDSRRALCRPWVTLAIDCHTRVVLGMYLSLHSPNAMSVALCMVNTILPKDAWLKKIGLQDVEYPFYGMPKCIHTDNAREFKSPALMSGCFMNNIKLKWRPPGSPRYGGRIERLVGTLMQKTHMLPGTTMSNVSERGDYNSEKHACLTYSEFKKWFIREVEIYHKTEHSALGQPPLVKWESCFRTRSGTLTSPPIVENPKRLLLQFMPVETRLVNREGVKKFGLVYYSPELKLIDIKTKCEVRFDESSICRIWILPEGSKDYIELNYSDITWPDISYEELKFYRRVLREETGRTVTPHQVFELREKNRILVKAAQADTKSARQRRERQQERREDPSHPLHTPKLEPSYVGETVDYARRPSTFSVDDDS